MNTGNPKSARRKSRELALQGIFEWLVSGSDAGAIEAFLHERYPTIKLDNEHFQAVLHGTIREAARLDADLQPYLDRPTRELSPVEHALLLMGAYELRFLLEVPYRVIINEAVDLAKVYGGTDGFKYVNGVLDRLAIVLRPDETGGQVAPEPYQEQAGGPRPNPAAKVPVSYKAKPAPRARSKPAGPRSAAETSPAPADVWGQRKPAAHRKRQDD